MVIKPPAPVAHYSLRSTLLLRRYRVNNFSDYSRFNKTRVNREHTFASVVYLLINMCSTSISLMGIIS